MTEPAECRNNKCHRGWVFGGREILVDQRTCTFSAQDVLLLCKPVDILSLTPVSCNPCAIHPLGQLSSGYGGESMSLFNFWWRRGKGKVLWLWPPCIHIIQSKGLFSLEAFPNGLLWSKLNLGSDKVNHRPIFPGSPLTLSWEENFIFKWKNSWDRESWWD